MANRKTKLTVGLFVISGLTLTIFTVIWLGMSHIFEEGRLFAAYFDESVQGLQKDSPVKYRGVSIGRVDAIQVAEDGNLIEVIMNIESKLENPKEVIGQLKSVGITGLVFIELERFEEDATPNTSKIDFPTRYPVIATKTSNMANILKEIEHLVQQMNSFDFVGISNDLKKAITQMNGSVKEADLTGLAKDIRIAVKRASDALDPEELKKVTNSAVGIHNDIASFTENANKTVLQMQQLISTNESAVNEAILDFKHSMNTADTLMGEGIDLLDHAENNFGTLQNRVYGTIDHLEEASMKLTELLDSVNSQPSQLFFSNPPTAKKIEE